MYQTKKIKAYAWVMATVLLVVGFGVLPAKKVEAAVRTVTVSSASELKEALKDAQPGDDIVLEQGTYTGTFSSSVDGTSDNPITIRSKSQSNKSVLQGNSTSTGVVLNIKGDYWKVRHLKVTNGQKGIVLDNANYCKVYNCEVYGVGMEGIHVRDDSSNNIVEACTVTNTGLVNAGYGEGIYVGTANSSWSKYGENCHYNKIKSCIIGPGVTGEHIDIKEGAIGTVVEGCTMNGTGMSGEHYADSFMDVKGNNCTIKNNVCYRNGNSNITNAFTGSVQLDGWGINNDFYGNTVHMDDSSGYVIRLSGDATATASDNTRTPSGNMYKGNVTEY